MIEQVLNIDRMEQIVGLFGSFDTNIRTLENEYRVTIVVRDGELKISGDAEQVALASRAVLGLLKPASKGRDPDRSKCALRDLAGQRRKRG